MAFVWLFGGVDDLVATEGGGLAKPFATHLMNNDVSLVHLTKQYIFMYQYSSELHRNFFLKAEKNLNKRGMILWRSNNFDLQIK